MVRLTQLSKNSECNILKLVSSICSTMLIQCRRKRKLTHFKREVTWAHGKQRILKCGSVWIVTSFKILSHEMNWCGRINPTIKFQIEEIRSFHVLFRQWTAKTTLGIKSFPTRERKASRFYGTRKKHARPRCAFGGSIWLLFVVLCLVLSPDGILLLVKNMLID